MLGNSKAVKMGTASIGIVIPAPIVRSLGIRIGNRVEFDVKNPNPEYIEEPFRGRNFSKNKNVNVIQPEPVNIIRSEGLIDEGMKAQVLARLQKENWKTIIPLAAGNSDYTTEELQADPDIAAAIRKQDETTILG